MEKSYIPKKDTDKHISLNVKDIPGAQPKNLKVIRGLKRLDFFPHEQHMNQYYNRETHGGNISAKGYFQNQTAEHQLKLQAQKLEKPSHRYMIKRNIGNLSNS